MAEAVLKMTEDLRAAAAGEGEAIGKVAAALKAKSRDLAPAAAALTPSESAKVLLHLKPSQARRFFDLLGDMPSIATLLQLDPSLRAYMLHPEDRAHLAAILSKQDPEMVADLLAGASPRFIDEVLVHHPQADRIRAAIPGRGETARAVMRHHLIALPEEMTVAEAIEAVRAQAAAVEKLNIIYVVDAGGRLLGHLKPRHLLLAAPEERLSQVMRRDPVQVSAEADRAEVLAHAERKRLAATPVTDAEGKLVGVITIDELRAIARAEAAEDFALMSGVDPSSTPMDGPLQIVPHRLPWLSAGLIGSGTAALVIGSFEDALTEAAILATLIPIVMSLAGNAGIQASTVTVQALSSGALWIGDVRGRLVRELGGALLNGAIVSVLVTIGIFVMSAFVPIDRPALLALTAALTLILITVQASVVGSMVPLALDRLKLDPAVATGVFITTSNDVVGVLIFFVIASAIYL